MNGQEVADLPLRVATERFPGGWQCEDDDKQTKTVAVLEIPPVDSPNTAVKVAIAAKAGE